MTFAPLPDAGANWVDRHAPEGLKPWLKLGRFDRPIGIWLLLLPGWQGIALALAQYRQAPGLYDLWLFVGFGIGACLMRAAGCAFNDIVDRDFDAQVARTAQRPIPSGRISVKQAWAFVVACSLISLLVLLTLPTVAILLGVGSLGLVAAYPFMKRITWWPQAWLGLTFNWGALMGFAAALPLAAAALLLPADLAGEFRPFLWSPASDSGHAIALAWQAYIPAALLWLGGVFWTLGYDTIYALQDIEDDAMIGVKSSARRLASAVRPGVAIFYGLTVILAAMTGLAAGLGLLFWLSLAIYAVHLACQIIRLDRNDGALALKLFKSNREAGLILLAAIALGSISL
ncbi:4-hydroxybenzoate polyprenyltransferase [Brevundimonas vesicularis]|uniref:4-hydroxybenzoate octaprenyltransferase n=1 Tax=Brevundimonas vesicularis TaxID=41276 RepID=A0A7W9FUX0_BREVE|nr:UbiA family prenyltransferase [Brevundimonas vesicularis]MBB5771961.1 4-hydroxybenzoate polyprenyltransferase [Brevundimonas vesicularis]